METRRVSEMVSTLESGFGPRGFEFYPFKIGWYNSCVQPIFHMKYDDDSLAVLVISDPSIFEETFLPYLKEKYRGKETLDPIDECMVSCFSSMKDLFPESASVCIHDFDLHPNRRPKMLMQTAAHVAGAAYFYQQKDLHIDENNNYSNLFISSKVYGVCIHPKYGGWFAIRGVIIFPNVTCPGLKRRYPRDVVSTPAKRLELLEKYNFNWEDGQFRDIIPVSQKYSDTAVKYFSTLPKDRFELIQELLHSPALKDVTASLVV